jgi:hypothetical protein
VLLTGTNGEIQYSVLSGNEHGFFMIDSKVGTIKVEESLDLETQKHVDDLIYVLTIGATDKGSPHSLSNAVIVTIEIKSVNEFHPQLQQPDSMYIRIPDTTGIGALVVDINATDADFGADGTLTYTISRGNDGNAFEINKDTGKITVIKKLDYSVLPRYFLEVHITDGAMNELQSSVDAKVTVRLTNANDSGGTDVDIIDLAPHITSPGDIAQSVGIPVSSTFEIAILRFGGGCVFTWNTEIRLILKISH